MPSHIGAAVVLKVMDRIRTGCSPSIAHVYQCAQSCRNLQSTFSFQSSVRSLVLDLGEDRVVLWGRPDLYHLDIFIPHNIIQEESGAQFNKSSKVLTITMPVQPV
ncbi:hypothetical protein FKM82_020903 [Ascaphus truei]